MLLANSEDTFRGGEFQTMLLARGLAKSGCEVRLAIKGGSKLFDEVSEEFFVYGLPFETLPFFTPLRLSSILNRWRPDILHAQSSRAHTHILLASKISRWSPAIVVSRRTAFRVSSRFSAILKYKRGVDIFLPISRAAAEELKKAGVADERVEIVPSGIDIRKFKNVAERRNYLEGADAAGTFVVGTVASFEKEKGCDVLLRAAAKVVEKFPNAMFRLYGDGSLREKLAALSKRLGIEKNVEFEGLKEPLEKVLARFDIFVLPSIEEGLSTALIAALASGCPVVASRTGGIPEVVGEGCGILVEPARPDELAESIATLLENESLRADLGTRASRCVDNFDIDVTVDRTLAVYKKLLSNR